MESAEGGLFAEVFLAAFAVEFFLGGEDRSIIRAAMFDEVMEDASQFICSPILLPPLVPGAATSAVAVMASGAPRRAFMRRKKSPSADWLRCSACAAMRSA